MSENAAVEKRSELPLDEPRYRAVFPAGAGKESLETVGNGPVERGLLGAARNVGAGRRAGIRDRVDR